MRLTMIAPRRLTKNQPVSLLVKLIFSVIMLAGYK